jgi:putative nucleotidyltransferase with HDIG domain
VELLEEKIRRSLDSVPPLPQLAVRIIREIGSPESSACSIAELATQDSSLTAALLRTANSNAYSPIRPITSVQESIAIIGLSGVRSLITRIKLEAMLGKFQASEDFEELWTHGLAVSMIAEALASRFGADRSFCSTLGLLHDIGKLLVLRTRPEDFDRLHHLATPGESALGRERRVLGADHADIGAHIASRWGLPAEIVEGIRFHHAPELISKDLGAALARDVAVVHVANQVAKYLHAYSDDVEIDIIGEAVWELLGGAREVESLIDDGVRKATGDALAMAEAALGRPSCAAGRVIRLVTEAERAKAIAEAEAAIAAPRVRPVRATSAELFAATISEEDRTVRILPSTRLEETPEEIENLLSSLGRSALEYRRLMFTLRWLVASARRLDANAEIELGVSRGRNGQLSACVRCDALRFDRRLGAGVSSEVAVKVLDRECSGVINLDWFGELSCSQDGGTLRLAA